MVKRQLAARLRFPTRKHICIWKRAPNTARIAVRGIVRIRAATSCNYACQVYYKHFFHLSLPSNLRCFNLLCLTKNCIRLIPLSEEIVTCSVNNEEETGAAQVGAPLLRYTNHERQVRENEDCAV